METVTAIQYILLSLYMISGQLMQSTLVFSPKELTSDSKSTNTSSVKLALRYGFHRISECDNYEKAFLCIRKCVDKGYDVAYSDKYCFCTCYVKKEKAKYTLGHTFTRTKWKLGTPTTTIPPWIQKLATAVKNKTKSSPKKAVTDVVANVTIASNGTNVTEKLQVGDLDTGVKNATDNQTASNVTDIIVNGTEAQNLTISDNLGNATNTPISQNSTDTTSQNGTVATNQNATIDETQSLSNNTNATPNETVSDVTNSTSSKNASAVTS